MKQSWFLVYMALTLGSLGAQAVDYSRPLGLTTDGKDLYFTDGASHVVKKYVLSTGRLETLCGVPGVSGDQDGAFESAQFYEPSGLAWFQDKLYVCDTLNQKIRVLDLKNRRVSTLWGPRTHEETLANPQGILVQGDRVLVADTYNHCIRSLSLKTNLVETLVGQPGLQGEDPLGPKLNHPVGLALGPRGLWISDTENHRLGLRNAQGRIQWMVQKLKYPGALGLGARDLLVADNGQGKVFKVDPQGRWQELPQVFGSLGFDAGPQGNYEGVQGFTTLGTTLYYVESIRGGLWSLNPDTGAVQGLWVPRK